METKTARDRNRWYLCHLPFLPLSLLFNSPKPSRTCCIHQIARKFYCEKAKADKSHSFVCISMCQIWCAWWVKYVIHVNVKILLSAHVICSLSYFVHVFSILSFSKYTSMILSASWTPSLQTLLRLTFFPFLGPRCTCRWVALKDFGKAGGNGVNGEECQ